MCIFGRSAMNYVGFVVLILLMVQKSQTTTWDVSNRVNNVINYQPQPSLPSSWVVFGYPQAALQDGPQIQFFNGGTWGPYKHD